MRFPLSALGLGFYLYVFLSTLKAAAFAALFNTAEVCDATSAKHSTCCRVPAL